jgi:copper chaperone CopZ
MDKVTYSIPTMWADHHVLAVRQALSQVNGVQEVLASSLYQDVLIRYDPAAVTPDALTGALAQAGYQVAQALTLPTYPVRIEDASDWFQFQDRVTVTDHRDLEMSGDFRKY